MKAQLIRQTRKGKAVKGTIGFNLNGKDFVFPTLENADFLIPAGTYPLKMSWSPKFKKDMPEIAGVPEREGIRIHLGSKPEHSTGCVLVPTLYELANIKSFIHFNEKYIEDEDLQIEIVDRYPA